MRKAAPFLLLLLFVFLLVAPSGARYLQYNQMGADAPATPSAYDPALITAVSTPIASGFQDEPERGDGTVLLDMAHGNQFDMQDVGYLNGRLSARGYTVQPHESGNLATALRSVSAYIVITPIVPFSSDEVRAVEDFVARGGHLLMIGDPTRYQFSIEETDFEFILRLDTDKIPLNSLSSTFDILYNDDYLYNTLENEGNFRNILLPAAGFAEDGLVDGLDQIAFYGSHSLTTGSESKTIIAADDDTWSSATDRAGGLTVVASGADGNVVALGDLQFLSEPYYTVYDNGEFITRLADFLATPLQGRQLELADFPYFHQEQVNLHYLSDPELGAGSFTGIVDLQNAFATVGKELRLTAVYETAVSTPDRDIIHVGLYNQAEEVTKILSSAGITLTIDPAILSPEEVTELADDTADEDAPVEAETRTLSTPLGTFQMAGSSMILWYESDGQNQVIVLAASNEGLDNSIDRLVQQISQTADIGNGDCLTNETLAICPSQVSDEIVQYEFTSDTSTPADSNGGSNSDNGNTDDGEYDNGDYDSSDLSGFIYQGDVRLDETITADLAVDEPHLWSFIGESVTVDIMATGDENTDLVLELYDANDVYVTSIDNTLLNETETLTAVFIEEGYSIVVHDFYGNAGSYTLSIFDSTAEANNTGSGNIFIFADDDGEPLSDGFTSAVVLESLLSPTYEITIWSATDDGALTTDMLLEYDLLIWDSGDYYDSDGFTDDDTFAIFEYIENSGDLFITGSAPTLIAAFADPNFATISDVVISANSDLLLTSFNEGDTFLIDPPVDALVVAAEDLELSENDSTPLFLRGDASEEAGALTAVAIIDELADNNKLVLMMLPFVSLPTAVQADMLDNFMAWYEM